MIRNPVRRIATAVGASLFLTTWGAGMVDAGYISTELVIPQRGGGTLAAVAYAPDVPGGPVPLISMLPGGGASVSSVDWAASRLATAGYVVIVTQPRFGGSTSSYNTAARSGIDFMLSASNPYLALTDVDRIGAAGWSLGARSLSRTQEEDLRIDAIVAWDNLAISENGDRGSPAGPVMPDPLRTPRVPALGQASDTNPNQSTAAGAKKDAFDWWRSHDVAAMEVVFANSNHFFWSANGSSERNHDLSHYYTQAWFDLWLKDDPTAADRLLATSVLGTPLATVLSDRFTSSAYLDGRDIPDLRAFATVPEPSGAVLLASGSLMVLLAWRKGRG